jgi:hypothetical protein
MKYNFFPYNFNSTYNAQYFSHWKAVLLFILSFSAVLWFSEVSYVCRETEHILKNLHSLQTDLIMNNSSKERKEKTTNTISLLKIVK